jgi:uncharacterized protein YjbI with pentapeptide repeats
MKRQILLLAAGLLMLAGATNAYAYDELKYQAIKNGKKMCQWCDLKGADLRKIRLSGVDLSGSDFTGANLAGASLTKVDLSGADLTSATVAGADLSGSNLKGADLDQVDLSGANIKGAQIETAYCDWATKLPANSGFVCAGVTIQRK